MLILVPVIQFMLLRNLKSNNHATAAAISRSLQVTMNQAAGIFRSSLRRFARFNIDYFLLCRKGVEHMLAQAQDVELIGAEQLAPFVDSTRPVIIVTMHMGNFQMGFLKLVSAIRTRRKISVFKVSGADRNEEVLLAAFGRCGHDISILRATEDGGRQAFMELRRGNVVAMTVDIEVHVTTREEVVFFGHPCQMQSGPAQLAVMTRAVIIPVITYDAADGRQMVRVEQPLYSEAAYEGESNRQAVHRLTQNIASLLESWIRIDPRQVMFWSGLAETIWHRPPSMPAKADLAPAAGQEAVSA
ncbi:lysophospholipid acyltransferase family protein [Massilia sp. TSP1-1-2]|uniref:lysophospholipid acyltransferase family protein n=1 Tax=Massilia sp. TSP1-1-2 TaxID=2804649 RepID=UPI003CEFBA1E